MYRKNVAGQVVGFAAVNASTGAAMAGTTGFAAYRVLDGGAQASATGTVTDKGNGQYSFALSQADINADVASLLFTMTGMVPVEKTLVTTACDPTAATNFGITNLDATISSRSTYAGGDTAGTTTLLSRLTSGRATGLDNLDAAVSTRMATFTYTAPPSATAIADAVLVRDGSNVEAVAPEHSLAAVIFATTEWSISGTAWTIFRSDGSTTFATKTITVSGGQVTGVA